MERRNERNEGDLVGSQREDGTTVEVEVILVGWRLEVDVGRYRWRR
jgi:hypothetical protein